MDRLADPPGFTREIEFKKLLVKNIFFNNPFWI